MYKRYADIVVFSAAGQRHSSLFPKGQNRKFFYMAGIILFYNCSEVFQPEVERVEPFLVVEGSISTKPGNCYVFLSNSRPYSDDSYYNGITGASVFVTDELGNTFTYVESGAGIYRLILDDGNTASIGHTYTLHIRTATDDIFESNPQTIVPSPQIERLYCRYNTQTILTEGAYGESLEVTYDGIDVLVETDGILPSKNYYLYDWKAYEEHRFVISPNPLVSYELFRHRILNGKYSTIIHTANADEYDAFQLRRDIALFIIKDDMVDYIPSYDTATYTLTLNRFEGLIIKMQQKSISADAYEFYSDAEQQLSAQNRLFDPISPQLGGNIKCISNESKKVVGIFYANDMTEKISYLYINPDNQTISKPLDSIPQLWLDTCSWSRPDDWIIPPI